MPSAMTTGRSTMTQSEPHAGEHLRQLINGYQVTQAIYVAVTLGLPDLLADGPLDVEELADTTHTDPGSLYRLLRALTAVGILRENRDGVRRRFALTEFGRLLRSDVPGSLAGWAAFVARPYHWDSWGDLLHTVRTGEAAFAAHHGGESIWNWRERHPEESRIFDRAMSAIASVVARRLVDRFDFDRFSSIADLGGGDGTLLANVLQRYPGVRGVLFDLPHVIAGATTTLDAAGVADRCQLVAGSFFDQVPPGCDAYVLKSILHDWDDASSVRILQRVRDASGPKTALLIVERVVDEADPSPTATMSDLNMMVNTGGRERTTSEWRTLLEASGFELRGTVDIGLGWFVIEGG
jgi:hypothetical protein